MGKVSRKIEKPNAVMFVGGNDGKLPAVGAPLAGGAAEMVAEVVADSGGKALQADMRVGPFPCDVACERHLQEQNRCECFL